MKKYTLLFAVFLISIGLQAQKNISKVVYAASHSEPISQVLNGENTLYFKGEKSLFIHNDYPKTTTPIPGRYKNTPYPEDQEELPVFFDYKNNVSYTKKLNSAELRILKEPIEKINWTITSETKMIDNYACHLATAEYEGRTYNAWFSKEIKAPYGPYRLRGLPGLILEAKSQDGMVSWEFVAYQADCKENIALTIPKNGKLFTWGQWIEEAWAYKKKLEDYWKAKSEEDSGKRYSVVVSDSNPEEEIERGKFCIYANYPKPLMKE